MIRFSSRHYRGSGVYISKEENSDMYRIAERREPLSANVKDIYNYVREINPHEWNLYQIQNQLSIKKYGFPEKESCYYTISNDGEIMINED
jgi:hypothetical protein